jgi:alpha-amylase/alpha-mannosidase (GH57 family)
VRVRLALLWHMHQPSYRDPIDGSIVLPWVRLHALKDYLGMVEVLEETPTVHATFNLVPCLLDQLEAYVSGAAEDDLQRICRTAPEKLELAERLVALRALFMATPNLVGRLPRLKELLEKRGPQNDEASLREADARFTPEDYRDLQVLAHLAWFDLGWRERDPVLKALATKGRGFHEADKAALQEREGVLLASVIPAYRRALEKGQIELSTSPYYHPILPLLCDTDSHHEAHPGAPVPRRFRHPEDAADQIQRAIRRHEAVFGRPPSGLWPSEGSVSEEAVLEIARAGLRWTASDEGVLARSARLPLHRDGRGTAHPLELLYRPWVRHTRAGDVALLFRDHALSDLVGFSYSAVEPRQAALDLLDRLRRVGERWQAQGFPGEPLVPVILDGENAWEYFPDGGRTFLRELYSGLATDPRLTAMTVSEALDGANPGELSRVFAGSWINADFAVWIGHADDRRAWDLLGEARDALVATGPERSPERRDRAWEIFRAACGSDWCWWYGEDHSSENDLEFDRLFRRHIRAIYEILDLPFPEILENTLITSAKLEVRQSHPSGSIQPTLNGETSSALEWDAAGVYRVPLAGSMHRGAERVRQVKFGVGGGQFFVRVEMVEKALVALPKASLDLAFPGPTTLRYRTGDGSAPLLREERTDRGWVKTPTRARMAVGAVVEIAVPLEELQAGPGRALEFRILVIQGEIEIERHPEPGPLRLVLEDVRRD